MEMLEYLFTDYYGTIVLVFITVILAMIMSANVKITFNKYNKVNSQRGKPAHEIARNILNSHGLYDVKIERTAGSLTDHYDPKNRIVALSNSVYNSSSVGAIGVAAHECGHAVQHAKEYAPIKIRTAIFPLVNMASNTWLWPFLAGVILNMPFFLQIGIIFFLLVVLFQLITLPVEFDASSRAMEAIRNHNLLDENELKGARKMLSAAAMTYVAALLVSLAQLLRILANIGRR